MESRLLSPAEVARYLGVPVTTIYRWRMLGGGPRGYRVGKHVRFRASDVETWLAEHGDKVGRGRS